MAPIRRYLRISRHSVLECRIFLENPADGPRWLLNVQDPALPRVFEAVKPYVLPKLREENERAKGKGKKKKSVKDVVKKDDFEVSIFLTEIGTRHSLLVKTKTFKEKSPITSNNKKLTGQHTEPVLVRDESDDEDVHLDDIPLANNGREDDRSLPEEDDANMNDIEDDKKKLGFNTTYEGFSIWGFVLCLLVERKGGPTKKKSSTSDGNAQALMEEWILTQQERDDDIS